MHPFAIPGSSNRHHRRRRFPLVAACALTVVIGVSGCGNSSASARDRKHLPGIKEFGLTEAEFADHVTRVESALATCMANAGFEYVPVDVTTMEAAQARVRKEPGYTRRGFKEKWGLAITTRFDDPVRDIAHGAQNTRIYKALAPTNQVAYDRTLYGDDKKASFVFTLDEEDFSTTGGCTRQAVKQVFTPAQLKGTFVNPKDVLLNSDPRVSKSLRDWGTCMKSHGYNYKRDQDEIISEYEDRLTTLLNGANPTTLTGDRLSALQQLQKEEIKVSLADLDCQLKHTDAVIRAVEIEVFGQPVSG